MRKEAFIVSVGMTKFAERPKLKLQDLAHQAIEHSFRDIDAPVAGEVEIVHFAKTSRQGVLT